MVSINSFLNTITMYRLMLYFLLFLVVVAAGLSFLRILPYNGWDILLEAVYLATVCRITNEIFAKIFKVKTNIESPLISGFILALIMGPTSPLTNWMLLTAAGVLAMASKYILAWKGRHIFNPAAFGAVAVALLLGQGASWWIGSLQTFPFVFLGGLLILKKIRRWEMVGVFLLIQIATLSLDKLGIARNDGLNLLYSPILFFTFVMLVEPLTSPTTKKFQIIYGFVVAAATFVIPFVLPDTYYSLELSLLIGNIFSYMVSGSFRQVVILKEKKQLTHDVISFLFEPTRKFQFKAGQFLEWTLSHPKPDSRGVRRFFTIASSPTEEFVILASKFYDKPSTFKQTLHKMESGDEIVISGLGGEFILPVDTNKKLVFIAGGIGITPFRSMVKYMVDTKEQRDVILLFSNKTPEDIVFKEIFNDATKLGVKTVYVNTDKDGFIDEKLIEKEVDDWKDRTFYISGPEPMVEAFEKMIAGMGVPKVQIKRDYFPGYTETYQR